MTELLESDAVEAAPGLLGCLLISRVGGETTAIRISEVEAYRQDDPASHSHRGITPRNRTMFGPAGRLYVYRSYGIHWCANVVTGPEGFGSAVLLRAGDPVEGVDVMIRRRGRSDHLTDGPGKLCQAMGIEGHHDGVDLLGDGPLILTPGEPPKTIRSTPRIGISKATDVPWRFVGEFERPGANLPRP